MRWTQNKLHEGTSHPPTVLLTDVLVDNTKLYTAQGDETYQALVWEQLTRVCQHRPSWVPYEQALNTQELETLQPAVQLK